MISRALFFEAPRRIAIHDVALPSPAIDEVLVRGRFSAISQGTEMLLYRGEGPEPFDPSLDEPLRGGGTGDDDKPSPTYPRRYGYAWIGHHADKRVFALAPHGDAHVLPLAALRAIRSDIPETRATLAANLETALTCTWDAAPSFGERVVVLGAGLVGILAAWLLTRSGANVTLVDPRSTRRARAVDLVPSARVFARDAAAATTKPDGRADIVIEASGDPRSIDDAIAWAAPSARIVVASFYGRRRAPIDLGDAFHRRRLSLIASQVSSVPDRLARRWDATRRFDVVQDLLGEPKLDVLIAPPIPFERAAELYARLDGDDDPLPCHVLEYG